MPMFLLGRLKLYMSAAGSSKVTFPLIWWYELLTCALLPVELDLLIVGLLLLFFVPYFPRYSKLVVSHFVNRFSVLLYLFSQLPVEGISQPQREPCSPQTTHIITPGTRAVSMTSLFLGTLVSISSLTLLQKLVTYGLLATACSL